MPCFTFRMTIFHERQDLNGPRTGADLFVYWLSDFEAELSESSLKA
jgi:hypothetical protein